jgi:glutamate--cysteine ligase
MFAAFPGAPMAADPPDETPIESRDQLVAVLESGSKPRDQWRVGTEHEKFGFHTDDFSPVAYEGPHGIRQLMDAMAGLLGWQEVLEDGKPIGLIDPLGQGAISLEPGGQFELSGAPLETVHQTCRELNAHLAQLRQCADVLGIAFLGAGFSPKWTLAETPIMPKGRYKIMRTYMPKVGTNGLDMMFRTCTVQANLDFGGEADMRTKMRVATALQPIATAIFANSPFTEGKPNGYQSYRSEVWRHTDPSRTGILPFVFDEGFGFDTYVDWALDVPMYFVKRDGRYVDVAGESFRDFIDGKLAALPGERATISDWNSHLTTMFPEVRLKRFMEVRGADAGPWRRVCALPAFWVGLLYEPDILAAALDLVRDWDARFVVDLRDRVPKSGLATTVGDETVLDIARRVVDLASEGLRRRGNFGASGADERIYIRALEETVQRGESPADRLLAEYRDEWHGDITELFRRYAY